MFERHSLLKYWCQLQKCVIIQDLVSPNNSRKFVQHSIVTKQSSLSLQQVEFVCSRGMTGSSGSRRVKRIARVIH